MNHPHAGRAAAAAVIVSVCVPAWLSWQAVGTPGVVFESSAFSADYRRYFAELQQGHSFWLWGQHTLSVIPYAPLYALLLGIESLTGSNSSAYHLALLGFQLLCLVALAAFFRTWQAESAGTRSLDAVDRIAPWLLALLYVSSLANFNYLKSNAIFAMAGYALPIQLYLADRYVRRGSRPALAALAASGLLLNASNATFFVYVGGLVGSYALLLRARQHRWRPPLGVLVADAARLCVAFLPAAILVLVYAGVGVAYYGSFAELAEVAHEGMYSNNATLLNIFALTTDWALFDGFNGVPYYEFGHYYLSTAVRLLALVMLLLPLVLAVAASGSRMSFFYALWIGVALACVFVQLGSGNPLYRWLMENFVVFQVFRNITKLSPVLWMALLAVVLHQLAVVRQPTLRRAGLVVFVVAGVLYNLPFWTYAGYFHRERSAAAIPSSWRDAGVWLDGNASVSSRVLLLPASYVNDTFVWNGRKAHFQGTLSDGLWRIPAYRLSEVLVGPVQMQMEMRRLFVSTPGTARGLAVDHAALGAFTRRQGFDFVVLSRDLWSEYQNLSEIRAWLELDGYRRAASFGEVEIYRDPSRARPLFESQAAVSWSRIDHLTYRLRLEGVTRPVTLQFNDAFRAGWRLVRADPPACAERCAASPLLGHFDDFRAAMRPAVAPSSHTAGPAGTNVWRIDPADIGPEAGETLHLVLHFKPQLQFIIACWAFLASLAAVTLSFLILPLIKRASFERPFHRHKTV